MSLRRTGLTVGVLGIFAMAPTRVRAVTTEVEAEGYKGDSVGGFACGPTMRANYGGAGARVRVVENDKRFLGQGFSGEVAGAVDHETSTVVAVPEGDPPARPLPDSWLAGSHVRAAYSAQNFGVALGATVFNDFGGSQAKSPRLEGLPDVEVYGGVPDEYRVVAGLGSPTVDTLRRPGIYLGADFSVFGAELDTRVSAMRVGPTSTLGTGLDVAAYLPVVPRQLDVKVAGQVNFGESDNVGSQAAAGVRAHF
jgi:hypothetical protein